MNFSDQTVSDAVAKEKHFKNFFGKVKEISRREWLKEEIGWRNREEDAKFSLGSPQQRRSEQRQACRLNKNAWRY